MNEKSVYRRFYSSTGIVDIFHACKFSLKIEARDKIYQHNVKMCLKQQKTSIFKENIEKNMALNFFRNQHKLYNKYLLNALQKLSQELQGTILAPMMSSALVLCFVYFMYFSEKIFMNIFVNFFHPPLTFELNICIIYRNSAILLHLKHVFIQPINFQKPPLPERSLYFLLPTIPSREFAQGIQSTKIQLAPYAFSLHTRMNRRCVLRISQSWPIHGVQ